MMLISTTLLSSCAIYSSGFHCPDSKGARCMMLSEVDKIVDSGEIETIYQNKKKRGKGDVPKLATEQSRRCANATKYYLGSNEEEKKNK